MAEKINPALPLVVVQAGMVDERMKNLTTTHIYQLQMK